MREVLVSGRRLALLFLGFTALSYLVIEALPTEFLHGLLGGDPLPAVVVAALVGIPAYVNTEGSLPLLAGLVDAGMSPGPAMAFLVTGAGTSIGAVTGMLVIARRRVVGLTVGILLAGALALGALTQVLLARGAPQQLSSEATTATVPTGGGRVARMVMTPDELLTTTRAVRRRLDLTRPVPTRLVRECLEIALQAPSGSNAQSWQWVVVTDADKRAAIGEIYRQQVVRYAESQRFAGRLFADRPERAPVQHRVGDSVIWLGEHMGEVPLLLLPCIRVGEPFQAVNQAALWGSLLPAAWSYCLAARARGLGTAWTSLHLAREAEVAEILGIPAGVHQGALIPTAFYTGTTFRPAAREPLEAVLHVDGWEAPH